MLASVGVLLGRGEAGSARDTLGAELTDFAGELGVREIMGGSKALAPRTERVQEPFVEMETIRNRFFGVFWFCWWVWRDVRWGNLGFSSGRKLELPVGQSHGESELQLDVGWHSGG